MKKVCLLLTMLLAIHFAGFAQNEEENKEEEKPKGFQKEKLFTGGSLNLGFSNNTFLVGVSPVLGYNLTDWADGGIVINYTYSSVRDYPDFNDKLRQSLYGGGVFTRLYAFRFLFAHAQFEHNFISQKVRYNDGSSSDRITEDASSLLVGAGYATGRFPGSGQSFFYMSVLFDVLKNDFSPYKDEYGRIIPIVKAGLQIPLFSGNQSRFGNRGRF